MTNDERDIRSLVATWIEASSAGDLPRVLELMDEDVVFIGAGRPPMRGKDAFAAASKASENRGRIEGRADIQEIQVHGDWAYCWNQLALLVFPAGGGPPTRLAGPSLSLLRKTAEGKWVIFRDANMITAET